VLKPVQPGHFAAITTDEQPTFMAAMGNRHGKRKEQPQRTSAKLNANWVFWPIVTSDSGLS